MKRKGVEIPLSGETRHIFVAVLSQDLDFHHRMSWSFCVWLSEVRGDCFVDIDIIVDHHV